MFSHNFVIICFWSENIFIRKHILIFILLFIFFHFTLHVISLITF